MIDRLGKGYFGNSDIGLPVTVGVIRQPSIWTDTCLVFMKMRI